MAWAWPSCLTDTAKLYGHVRTVSYKTKIKETWASARHSSGVLLVGFDSHGTDGFPKAAMQNRGPRGSLHLFTLFCLASLYHGWKIPELNLTWMICSFSFYVARNQLFRLSDTNIKFQVQECFSWWTPFSPSKLISQAQFVIFISSEHY